jgi:hypothetical protein
VPGCTELEKFNISHNKVTVKTGPELKKFLQSCGRLSELRMRDTAVPVQVVRDVIKAIIANKYLADFHLDLATNKLGPYLLVNYLFIYLLFMIIIVGVLGANMLSGLAAEITSIKNLDLTDNDFGDEGMSIIADGNPHPPIAPPPHAILCIPFSSLRSPSRAGLCHNSSLRELHLGDNWTRNKTKLRGQAVDNLIGTPLFLFSFPSPISFSSIIQSDPLTKL